MDAAPGRIRSLWTGALFALLFTLSFSFRAGDLQFDLGALVDVRIEAEPREAERTLFFLPVGAGTELHGPGGDGFVVVVTPQSPVGKCLLHSRPGDSFEIVVDGRDREWTVVDLV